MTINNFLKDLEIDYNPLIQIKVTPDFLNCLEAHFRDEICCYNTTGNSEGYRSTFVGVPIVLDKDIKTPYELIYKRG